MTELPDDLRRAFVAGAQWWEFHEKGFEMWQLDETAAEKEAETRYPKPPEEKQEQ